MAAFSGNLTRDDATAATAQLNALLKPKAPIDLDLSGVQAVDSAGAAILADFTRRAQMLGVPVQVRGLAAPVARTLRLFPFPNHDKILAAPRPDLTERVGDGMAFVASLLFDYLLLCADVTWFTVAGLRRRGIRWQAVVYEMAAMGSQAFGVAGLISFLVGATVALQSAAQLRQFGANVFVADLIGVSITRELGPLMTAIVVAGRSGSAVAAEIGTMVITEEIDALRTMGLNPTRYLIVPKVIAISLTQPLLTVLADFLAILGGFIVAVLYLEVSPAAFLGRLQSALFMKDVLTGLFKSLLFANLIVSIGSLCGLRTAGGADAVGRSTTTSVVAAIFAIIVADAACSMLFYFGG